MKPSRRLILAAVAFAAVASFLVSLSLSRNEHSAQLSTFSQTPASTVGVTGQAQQDAGATGISEAQMSARQRKQNALEAMHQLLKDAQQQPGNLQKTLRLMQENCTDPADCSRQIEQALASFADQAFAALVRNAMERLPLYEAAMQETVMSTDTPPRERYATIQALREQILGEQEAEALFGQESAWAEYQFRFGEMMSDPAFEDMSADSRLQALEQVRSESFGSYADPLTEVEGSHGRYERELAVLTHGLEDSAEKDRIIQQLRVTHFGEETAAQMAQRDEVVREQQQVLQDYNAAVSELDARMAPLKDTMGAEQWNQQYEQALREIRLQYFP